MPQKKILPSGRDRWVGRFRDAGGKEHTRTFNLKREAQAWEDENKAKVKRGTWVDPSKGRTTTLLELAERWRDNGPREGTRKDRQQLIDNLVERGFCAGGCVSAGQNVRHCCHDCRNCHGC